MGGLTISFITILHCSMSKISFYKWYAYPIYKQYLSLLQLKLRQLNANIRVTADADLAWDFSTLTSAPTPLTFDLGDSDDYMPPLQIWKGETIGLRIIV